MAKKKIGRFEVNAYKFHSNETNVGFNFAKEDFAPWHDHTTYDLTLNLRRRCVYFIWRRKNK